jgi:hypothetical protein
MPGFSDEFEATEHQKETLVETPSPAGRCETGHSKGHWGRKNNHGIETPATHLLSSSALPTLTFL